MDPAHELATLPQLTVAQLRKRYAAVFGEATNARHKVWLCKRIAWRLQASAQGDLSQRARQRAALLADDANLRLNPPKPGMSATATAAASAPADAASNQTPPQNAPERPASGQPDPRLPPPGTVLTRLYKGQELQVTVLPCGFAYQGQAYPSLSALAKVISGSHCNGFLFFRLLTKETRHEN
jgi:hypothetical protein